MTEVMIKGRIMPASNATFLAEADGRDVVYKPVAGERPLWDFPDGTLAGREVAAYLVSRAMGWDLVPRTWWGEGPHGPGMVQEWQEVDPDEEAVTLLRAGDPATGWLEVVEGLDAEDRRVVLAHEDTPALRRLAVFDVVINNADRKGGHVLGMPAGVRLGVDHGLAFHEEHKLRTVLWGWARRPLSEEESTTLHRLLAEVRGDLGAALLNELTDVEVKAFEGRIQRLLAEGTLPAPNGGGPAIPWPPF